MVSLASNFLVAAQQRSGRTLTHIMNSRRIWPHFVKRFHTLFILIALLCPTLRGATYFPVPVDDGRAEAERAAKRKAISAAGSIHDLQQAAIQQRLAALAKEPWRIVNGVTNSVYGKDWYHFSGQVLKTYPDSILVRGSVSSLESENRLGRLDSTDIGKASVLLLPEHTFTYQEFVVTNFPYVVADGDNIKFLAYYMVKEVGTVVLTNHAARNHDAFHKYDYGKVCPPPPEWVAAVAAKAAKAKETAAAAILKLDQEKAAEGSALYQYRLGRRYLTGNGVEMDLLKAHELFKKAADQGNEEAAAELRNLSANKPPQSN
jgi:hypothetical protein